MGKMDVVGLDTQTLEIPRFDGVNTALAFSELKNTEALKLMNGLPGSLGSLAKRPGTIPVTNLPLDNPIKGIFNYRKNKASHTLLVSNNKLFELQDSSPNLVPSLSSWTLHPNATVQNEKIVLSATASGQLSYVDLTILPNKKYEFKKTEGTFQIFFYDNSNAVLSGIFSPTFFTTPNNAVKARIETVNSGPGTFYYSGVSVTGNNVTEKNGNLTSSDIDQAQFKDENGEEVLIVADGGNLKYYNGTEVKDITPAADDDPELPANDLATINANHKPIGCLVHGARVVIWDGSDTIWHSKVGYYDYFPQTDYIRFVRKGDYIQTCVTYRGALLVFLRDSLAVLFGQDIGNWQQDFLSTEEGCLNPKTVQQVTFPDGKQEIFYLSDNGVQAVYTIDTVLIDSQARYSTRSVSRTQIDWKDLGVSKDEWQRAVAHFYDDKYWLIYPKGNEWHGLVFDTVFSNWYFINNIDAHAFFDDSNTFLFASDTGHVKRIDESLFSDWDDVNKTTGKPIDMYWYSNLLTPKVTGMEHFWDIVIIEAKQHMHKSTVDLEFNTYDRQLHLDNQLKTEMTVWGSTVWGETQWPSLNLTHFVNYADRLRVFQRGKYMQIKISNNRDEPIEIYNITLEVRAMRPY